MKLICPQCEKEFEAEEKYGYIKKFCSRSCSNKRIHSDKTKNKISTSIVNRLKKHHTPPMRIDGIYEKLFYNHCVICGKLFTHKREKQTCSNVCHHKLISNRQKENMLFMTKVNKNRGRHKKSYLEKSFEDWLILNNYTDFITEQSFRDTINKKTYFADFYFPSKNLIIELDGTQHYNTKEYDLTRDSIISDHYGITIIRISHKEYISKEKEPLIRDILGI